MFKFNLKQPFFWISLLLVSVLVGLLVSWVYLSTSHAPDSVIQAVTKLPEPPRVFVSVNPLYQAMGSMGPKFMWVLEEHGRVFTAYTVTGRRDPHLLKQIHYCREMMRTIYSVYVWHPGEQESFKELIVEWQLWRNPSVDINEAYREACVLSDGFDAQCHKKESWSIW